MLSNFCFIISKFFFQFFFVLLHCHQSILHIIQCIRLTSIVSIASVSLMPWIFFATTSDNRSINDQITLCWCCVVDLRLWRLIYSLWDRVTAFFNFVLSVFLRHWFIFGLRLHAWERFSSIVFKLSIICVLINIWWSKGLLYRFFLGFWRGADWLIARLRAIWWLDLRRSKRLWPLVLWGTIRILRWLLLFSISWNILWALVVWWLCEVFVFNSIELCRFFSCFISLNIILSRLNSRWLIVAIAIVWRWLNRRSLTTHHWFSAVLEVILLLVSSIVFQSGPFLLLRLLNYRGSIWNDVLAGSCLSLIKRSLLLLMWCLCSLRTKVSLLIKLLLTESSLKLFISFYQLVL